MYRGDYYDFLGIKRNASTEEIKHAYRTLAKKYHPDTGSEKTDVAFKELRLIYLILIDPIQRKSYDYSTSHSRNRGEKTKDSGSSKTNTKADYNSTDERKNEVHEDFSKAIFVDGIEAEDSAGNRSYVKLGDYVYYPVSVKKRAFFFDRQVVDYYRVRVDKIYSRKRNSFKKIPLLVVIFGDVELIVFAKDFADYWLSERSLNKREKNNAIWSLVTGLTIIVIIFYILSIL